LFPSCFSREPIPLRHRLITGIAASMIRLVGGNDNGRDADRRWPASNLVVSALGEEDEDPAQEPRQGRTAPTLASAPPCRGISGGGDEKLYALARSENRARRS